MLTCVEICKCLWSLSCGGVPNMLPVLSITIHCHYYTWGCMYPTGPFQFRWLKNIHSSCYYHHQIGSINLTDYHIFPWFWAWNVCCIIFCQSLHIHSGKTGILFSLLSCSLWWVQIVGYVLACRSCSLHQLIIMIVQTYLRHWTYEIPVRFILSNVWVILSIFSQLFILKYMGLCVFSLPISLVMIERIYTLSYYHEIGSMNYNPLFRDRSWNNGMRCMSLYILIILASNLTASRLHEIWP